MKCVYAFIAMICMMSTLMFCGCQHQNTQVRVEPQKPAVKLLFPEDEVPGEYYFGEGALLNCYFELKTDHRFTYKWSSDIHQYSNKGTWRLNGDVLTIYPDEPVIAGLMPIRYIPVIQDGGHMLIDENKLPGFCAKWNDKGPPRMEIGEGYFHLSPVFFKVEKTTSAPSSDRPVIPERYWDFYDNGPVRATVIRTSDARHAVIDKGSLDRVKPGMLFSMSYPSTIDIEVIAVDEHESEVCPIYYDDSKAVIKAGDKFTTGDITGSPELTSYERLSKPPKL